MSILPKLAVTVFSVFLISASSGIAQFYIQAGGGYGLDISGQSLGRKRTSIDTASTQEIISVSFAGGPRIGGNAGYMFTKNFGAELGAYYLIGSDIVVAESTSESGTSTSKAKGSGLFFSPTLIFSADVGGFSPFAKFGAIVGFPNIKVSEADNNSFSGTPSSTEEIFTFSGGNAIGLTGSAGIIFPFAERFAFIADITSSTLSYAPTLLTIDKMTRDGVDVQIPDDEKTVDLVVSRKSYEDNQLTQNLPFSSIAFNLGFRMNF